MIPYWPHDTTKAIVAPLNWGLGHAARSIPVIRALLRAGIEVIIASDGEALAMLHEEFPTLHTETIAAYNVKYAQETLWGIIAHNGLNVTKAITKEYFQAQKLVKKHQPNLIISDSRFGFRSHKVKSVIITHQLHLLSTNALLSALLNASNTALLNRFAECWIPDTQAHTWSGRLSQSSKVKHQKFIGPLSRLTPAQAPMPLHYDLTIMLSGPEPARSKLESQLIQQYTAISISHKDQTNPKPKRICLVRGTTRRPHLKAPNPNWTIINRATTREVNEILLTSHRVISRSGYTSIMDYAALGIKATLIPTPGQPEQEYLAEYHLLAQSNL